METRAIRQDMIVPEDGVLSLTGMTPGEHVEVIVLRPVSVVPASELKRWGWAKGKVHIQDNFDDPVPGLEPYL